MFKLAAHMHTCKTAFLALIPLHRQVKQEEGYDGLSQMTIGVIASLSPI